MPDFTEAEWEHVEDSYEKYEQRLNRESRQYATDALNLSHISHTDRLWVAGHALLLSNGARDSKPTTTELTAHKEVFEIPKGVLHHSAKLVLVGSESLNPAWAPFCLGKIGFRLSISVVPTEISEEFVEGPVVPLVDVAFVGPQKNTKNMTEISEWHEGQLSNDRQDIFQRTTQSVAEAMSRQGDLNFTSFNQWAEAYQTHIATTAILNA